jgi:hypothetical protein
MSYVQYLFVIICVFLQYPALCPMYPTLPL